jgi:hypothetical protein
MAGFAERQPEVPETQLTQHNKPVAVTQPCACKVGLLGREGGLELGL